MQTKACSVCGEQFSRNPKYGRAQWERAAFCSNVCRGRSLAKPRALCGCGCGEVVAKTHSRFRPGHNPPARSGTVTLWQAPGRKPRYVFRGRDGRQVYFARAVMEAHLRRPLNAGEVVHHINGDSTDDRPENLQVFSSHAEHMRHEYDAGALVGMN